MIAITALALTAQGCLGFGAIDTLGTVTSVQPSAPASFSSVQVGEPLLGVIDVITDVSGQPLPNGGTGYFNSPHSTAFTFGSVSVTANGPTVGTAVSVYETVAPATDVLDYVGTFDLGGQNGTIRFEFVDANGDLFPAVDLFAIPFPLLPPQQVDQTATVTLADAAGTVFLEAEVTWIDLRVCAGNVCQGVPNSTGFAAELGFSGTPSLANNDLVLECSRLPTGSAGYFICSTQVGFIANPAGSQGNLCLAGVFGRFVGPGQVQLAGSTGIVSLPIDLTQIPLATGPVAGQAGESWVFQSWYRDSLGGVAVSNFSSASSITLQ